MSLPIDRVLPAIVASLRKNPRLVVVAPPGAGKSTRVPQAILDSGLLGRGRLLMLEPRRVAARALAERIAWERKGTVGAEIGYQVRFENKTSKATRLVVLTEGLLTRKLHDDPTLDGVSAVILDEFHERSIHADLAISFLREVQQIRPELGLVVMSATIDAAQVAKFLGDCPIIESDGGLHPVTRTFLERGDDRPLVDQVVGLVKQAYREGKNDVLTFLPGAFEIERVRERLDGLPDVDVRMLYGALEPRVQDEAIRKGPRRKIILATNIAESSITIEGVDTVVDSGYEKRLYHDPRRGIDRLEFARISRANAEQRAGRAGRLGPGQVFRLWTEREHNSFAERPVPEVSRIDLANALLEVIAWSSSDPRSFAWFETPPLPMIERGLMLLETLGAIDGFRLTERGRLIRAFPLHPRIASILIDAHRFGLTREGALLAAVCSEGDFRQQGNESGDSDLLALAERASRSVYQLRDQLITIAGRVFDREEVRSPDPHRDMLRVLLAGFPDRVAKRRERGSDRFLLAGGRGARLAKESVVKEGDLIIAIDVDDTNKRSTFRPDGLAGGAESLIRVASHVDESWLEDNIAEYQTVRWNPSRQAAEGLIERRYLDLVLDARNDPHADSESLARLLETMVTEDMLSLSEDAEQLLCRIEFIRKYVPDAGVVEVSRKSLIPFLCEGCRSIADVKKADAAPIIRAQVGGSLERHAPSSITVPGLDRPVRLRYEAQGPPVLSARIQHLFGLKTTPLVANGRVPVKVELLAPNQRPVQVTQDLASFWRTTYPEVRKQLRARYPKHKWPETVD